MKFSYILGIIIFVTGSNALYDSSSDVIDLTPSNFDKQVLNSDDVWIVEFYAPWCGHCKNLVPSYKKAATALKGFVKVGALDADAHKDIAKKYGVSGFPTIKIFSGGKHSPYNGARTPEGFVDTALNAVKEKAYASLGKKAGSSSEKKIKNIYGHVIPWKPVVKTELKKQIEVPLITSPFKKIRFNYLQATLFRIGDYREIKPKVIKAQLLPKLKF